MARIDQLLKKGRTLSFELMPPRSPKREHQLEEALPDLEALRPSFVSVTYGAGGSTREGTHDLVKRLLDERHTAPMAHLTTAAQSRAELVDILLQYRIDGLENILALRGDPPLDSSGRIPEGDLKNVNELVELAQELGDFCIAVAAHPEGHPKASSKAEDRRYQANKMTDANFAITQFFFEADVYFRFVEDLAALGVDKPIIPGLMAPVSVKQLERMAEMAGSEIPQWVHDTLLRHGDDEPAVAKAGVEIVADLARKLLEGGAPGIHIYTMNRSQPAREIFAGLDLEPVPPFT